MDSVIVKAAKRLPINFKNLPAVGILAQRIGGQSSSTPFDEVSPGLFVGSSLAGREYSDRFSHRISVAQDLEYATTTASFNLSPTDGDRQKEFSDAVDATVEALEDGGGVLVHCHEGRERAPTVAATALASRRGWGISKAIQHVREGRGVVEPTPQLRGLAREYLNGCG